MKYVARPQSLRSRAAIIEAAEAIIQEEGAAAVTHQRVAERAGVGRATVYRHWPRPEDLLQDALRHTRLNFLEPGPGTLHERVLGEMLRIADELNSPAVMTTAATLLERALWDPDSRDTRDRVVGDIIANIDTAIEEAFAAGELRERPTAERLFAQLLGPLFGIRLLRGELLTSDMVSETTELALGPWLTAHT